MPPSPWQCSACLSDFSRLEHLRRHIRSHEDRRPFHCGLCRRSFTRKDALKRHEKTCKPSPSRSHLLPPHDGADDTNTTLFPASSGMDFDALDWLYTSSLTSDRVTWAESLEYLAYFTSAKGMTTFLDQHTLKQRQQVVLQVHDKDSLSNNASRFLDSSLEMHLFDSYTNPTSYTIEPSRISTSFNDIDPLSERAREVVRHLQSTITNKPDKNVIKLEWTPETQEACRVFFCPRNIRRFLEYFWSLWYPNCPIVHRPSFDPLTASPALLLVMLVIGACLSPGEKDGREARVWLDTVEGLIFSEESMEQITQELPASHILRSQTRWKKQCVENMQAVYLVCSLQKREGDIDAQARIRRYRHATMVSLARDIGLKSATHQHQKMTDDLSSWWRQFTVDEERIRTLTYVFLFDAALTIFHNSPPRMVVPELKMDMACPESCFQAESAVDCFSQLCQWQDTVFWREKLSVSAVVRRMCQGSLNDSQVLEFSGMSTLDMFTAVQCLHSLTFHLRNSIVFESTLSPVQNGLDNWRRIWDASEPEDRNIPDHPETIWKKTGFARYAPEFWQLARIILDKMASDNAHDEQDAPPGSASGLPRYDHTDMMDVNGLIMEYRRMSLSNATST